MGKKVLITGASSGIGRSCAYRFASEGYDLVITARRADRLRDIAADIKDKYNVEVIALDFDISSQDSTLSALNSLPSEFKCPDILINNAGLALGLKPFHEADPTWWTRMIDTNVKGLIFITGIIAPLMVEKQSGHIINIGSIAGRDVYPGGNVYSASKAAVDSFTKSLRIDLLPYGIRVSQIAPAATETEFSNVRFEGDNERADKVYQGYQPLTPEDISEIIWFTASRPAHVNISDMLIMPTAQAGSNFIFRKNTDQ